MTYIGPIIPRPQPVDMRVRPSSVTPVAPYAENPKGSTIGATYLPPNGVDRRKGERRRSSGRFVIETRVSGDRRRQKHTKIDIKI